MGNLSAEKPESIQDEEADTLVLPLAPLRLHVQQPDFLM